MAPGPHGARAGGRLSSLAARAFLAASLAALAAAPLCAQTPSLDQVDSLIAEGRTEAARAALVGWMSAAPTRSRAETQRALWQRALLTVDPEQAAVDYQRLVVEYPGGSWAARALLRLAQAAQAQGDGERARRFAATLLRDYPGSPAALDDAALIDAVPASPPGAPSAGAAAPPSTADESPAPSVRDPVPPARPVEVAAQEPKAPPTPTPAPAKPAPTGRRWTVQLGAFASPERARGLREEVGAGGVEARLVLVPGSKLIRVRTGRFESQADADRARDRLAARGITATVAGDADREEAAP